MVAWTGTVHRMSTMQDLQLFSYSISNYFLAEEWAARTRTINWFSTSNLLIMAWYIRFWAWSSHQKLQQDPLVSMLAIICGKALREVPALAQVERKCSPMLSSQRWKWYFCRLHTFHRNYQAKHQTLQRRYHHRRCWCTSQLHVISIYSGSSKRFSSQAKFWCFILFHPQK